MRAVTEADPASITTALPASPRGHAHSSHTSYRPALGTATVQIARSSALPQNPRFSYRCSKVRVGPYTSEADAGSRSEPSAADLTTPGLFPANVFGLAAGK